MRSNGRHFCVVLMIDPVSEPNHSAAAYPARPPHRRPRAREPASGAPPTATRHRSAHAHATCARAPLRLRHSCGLARPRGQPLPPLCVPAASTCTETSAQARRAHTRRPDNPLATPGVALIWLSSFRPPATSRHRTCPPEARCSARPSQSSASIQGSI